VRDRLISRRTAVIINQLRAFLLERGMVFAQTPAKLKAAMADMLENAEADLTPQMQVALAFARYQALGRSSPRPSLPPSATAPRSARDEILQRGSA
jgi:hypothetical protein